MVDPNKVAFFLVATWTLRLPMISIVIWIYSTKGMMQMIIILFSKLHRKAQTRLKIILKDCHAMPAITIAERALWPLTFQHQAQAFRPPN